MLSVLLLLTIGVLQLPQSKEYITGELESVFNRNYNGELVIGQIDGFLPFSATIKDVNFTLSDDSLNSVLRFDEASVKISWWQLLQQNVEVTSFDVSKPIANISKIDSELNIGRLFTRSNQANQTVENQENPAFFIQNLSFFVPEISVSGGSAFIDNTIQIPENTGLKTPLEAENIDIDVFIEVSEEQLFFELSQFRADLPGTPYDELEMRGQFYNDGEYFELNRFEVRTNIGSADFSFEAIPVDVRKNNFKNQFLEADYSFEITRSSLSTDLIQQFLPGYPSFKENLILELQSEGNASQYFIDRFQANMGESAVLISAEANDIFNTSASIEARLDNVVIHPNELTWASENYFNNSIDLEKYQLSTIRGEMKASRRFIEADFLAQTEAGSVQLDGALDFVNKTAYNFNFEVDSLDITPFVGDSIRNSQLQGGIALHGTGFGEDAEFVSMLNLNRSVILGTGVDQFEALFTYIDQTLNYDITGSDAELMVTSSGNYRDQDNVRAFTAEGRVQNFDIKKYVPGFYAESTNFSGSFSTNLQGSSINDVEGRVSFEIDESTIDRDTLRAHQFYADISDFTSDRRIRFTSSFFDGEISGTLRPTPLREMQNYWSVFFNERIQRELKLLPDSLVAQSPVDSLLKNPESVHLDFDMAIKDLSLLRKYFPNLPQIESNAQFKSSITATSERFLVTGNLFDSQMQYGSYSAEALNTDFTASFNHNNTFKKSATVDVRVNSGNAQINSINLKESEFLLSMRDDSIRIIHFAERLEDDLSVDLNLYGLLDDDIISVSLENLSIGTSAYRWESSGIPEFNYRSNNKISVSEFVMVSDSDFIRIDGTFSDNIEDQVFYEIQNFDLQRVSDLIPGRVNFSGILNGDFQTRTLTEIPVFQGNFEINNAMLQNRTIGDVSFSSELNQGKERFDTSVRVYTDPEKYGSYVSENSGIGQDLRLDGFFRLPNDNLSENDKLFEFNADLSQIDMWIVSVIVPNIVSEMEGSGTGSGTLSGNLNDFDFNSRFNVAQATGTPAFTDVEYDLSGELTFNKSEGLIFEEVRMQDSEGGTGVLTGYVDLNDFLPTKFINIRLSLNDLQFLDTTADPDIPFYGSIFGTGEAEIVGTNISPVLRTIGPVRISPNSVMSIPLEPETEIEQERSFIEFVQSFDGPYWGTSQSDDENGNGNGEDEELTFLQRFTMDMQFEADDPFTVRMIFDEVTSDILTADGTGQMRILLEDQDVSLFGRYNIASGNYQFVSGDIFTRRFSLEQGGTISWSGDLIDADLDVTAVYRARPNISTLLSGPAAGAAIDASQRVPVELVLVIGGTINQVENDFFFRMPTGIEGVSDPTITAQINNLNQNEDEKLIQATSILISGNFLPSTQAQGLGITESFSSAAVVSPFVTSQIINPLLSNQINSLLRSDITFDIDFNLNQFNEVDLGVALRLFDDRIILRREGQITGEQSDIGDIGATYRINRTFSVTAFHRQDPTLSYTSNVESRQSQEMNGVGLEAQVQFNTWQNLRARIAGAFRKLVGINNDNEAENTDQEEIAEQ